MHFDGTKCRLASRVVEMVPAVVDLPPACTIRPTCRWHQQEGRRARERCPQIVTLNDDSGNTLLATMAYGPREADELDQSAPHEGDHSNHRASE